MTYPQPSAPTDRTVNGLLASVEQRQGGWYRFSIQEQGQQYPLRADTKKVDLIQQAMSLIGQQVSASIREAESTSINPNSGRPYINRHLNGIAPQGYAPGVMPTQAQQPQQVYQPQPQPQTWQMPPQGQMQQPQTFTPPQQAQPQLPQSQPPIMGYDKDINIMRQTASKVASRMMETLPPEQQTMQGLVALCEAWMAYYVYGPLRFGVQAFTSASGQPSLDGNPGGGGDWGAPDPASEADLVYQRTGVCPDCGFSGGNHAVGCPRGEFVQA